VKLFVNGLWRKVVIDDLFPVDEKNKPLCAYSDRLQLWVSILEKAYLKVNGGYDFKGSVSSTDLFAFTSWLPEKVNLKEYDL
jgi:calpain-7